MTYRLHGFPSPSPDIRPYYPPFLVGLVSSSLLHQQCPICLVRLIWMVFEMGGRWLSCCCSVGCCLHDLYNTARSILVLLQSSFFSIRLVSVHVVHPYSSTDRRCLH